MVAAVLIASLASLLGCAGELPRKDGRVGKEATPVDIYTTPDVSKPSPDTWPVADGYVPAPFGCLADADCFGGRCCRTPWGVKLCATTCEGR